MPPPPEFLFNFEPSESGSDSETDLRSWYLAVVLQTDS